MQIFCFDLDQTLFVGHVHGTLRSLNVKPGSRDILDVWIPLAVSMSGGMKHLKRAKYVMQKIINAGHHIAITSFTSYPESAYYAMQQLGLDSRNTPIICGLPETIIIDDDDDDNNNNTTTSYIGKNRHIQKAMQMCEKKFAVLIDDDKNNIQVAKNMGHQAIHVPILTFFGDANANANAPFEEMDDAFWDDVEKLI